MKKKDKQYNASKIFKIVGAAVLVIVGVTFIPSFIKKYSNKAYKHSLKREEIDFENLGPEIVPHDKKENKLWDRYG